MNVIVSIMVSRAMEFLVDTLPTIESEIETNIKEEIDRQPPRGSNIEWYHILRAQIDVGITDKKLEHVVEAMKDIKKDPQPIKTEDKHPKGKGKIKPDEDLEVDDALEYLWKSILVEKMVDVFKHCYRKHKSDGKTNKEDTPENEDKSDTDRNMQGVIKAEDEPEPKIKLEDVPEHQDEFERKGKLEDIPEYQNEPERKIKLEDIPEH